MVTVGGAWASRRGGRREAYEGVLFQDSNVMPGGSRDCPAPLGESPLAGYVIDWSSDHSSSGTG